MIYSCECHGHGFTCDPVTGEKCNCGNNTESEPSCTSGPMKATNMGGTPCWMVQCSKCRENYAGTPTMGHQCYKTVTVDNKMCFDSKLIGKFDHIYHCFNIVFAFYTFYRVLHLNFDQVLFLLQLSVLSGGLYGSYTSNYELSISYSHFFHKLYIIIKCILINFR